MSILLKEKKYDEVLKSIATPDTLTKALLVAQCELAQGRIEPSLLSLAEYMKTNNQPNV